MSLRFDLLAVLLVLLMLGCASTGEEQNYKVLDQDRERFRTEPDDGYSSAEMPVFQIVAVFEQDESVDSVTYRDGILNRKSWPVVSIEPMDGATTHRPYYFRDCPIDESYVDVLEPPTIEQRLNAALKNERAGNWSGANLLAGVVQPVKFAADTLLLPVRAVIDLPWKNQQTPTAHRTLQTWMQLLARSWRRQGAGCRRRRL